MNVFADEWDETPYPTPPGWEQRTKGLVAPGHGLGMRLYELPSGQTQVLYHFHHGNEEAVVVLSGAPTVRTPEEERVLAPGDVVFFAAGPDGAHQLYNVGDEPARYLIAASHVSPEVVEYPDSGKVLALSRLGRFGRCTVATMPSTSPTASSLGQTSCKNRTFDAGRRDPYPSQAMLLRNVTYGNPAGCCARPAGPRGRL